MSFKQSRKATGNECTVTGNPWLKGLLLLFVSFLPFFLIVQNASAKAGRESQRYLTVYEINTKDEENGYVYVRGRIHIGFEKYRVAEAFRDQDYDSDFQDWIRTGRNNPEILAPYCLSIINKYEFENNFRKMSKFDGKIVNFKAFVVRKYRSVESIASGDCEFSSSGILIDIKTLKIVGNIKN